MKNAFKLSMVLLMAAIVMVSCEKEKEAKLSITNVVAENHDGGSEIPRGGTISVNFTATAGENARLDFYHIEIHDHPASGLVQDEYKIIDDDFMNKSTFKGLRNANVHEHVVVPDTANLGSYHVVIVVVDEDGNSVDTETLETHITIVEQ
ncbi:MAG: DUF4625 domain-containing protein [Bacteroidales bacterium]|nr:DUF4625 domain-containing protein [Bacteroidales bacterium]